MQSSRFGIVLAAGKGTRMKSDLPKCLHEVCGLSMVELVLATLAEGGVEHVTVVVGHGADAMRKALGPSRETVLQEPQSGTGHAVAVTSDAFAGRKGSVIVACGDVPLVRAETIRALIEKREATGAACVLATVKVPDPTGYGRIVRKNGMVAAIVEQKDGTPEQLNTSEINPALYCFDVETLFRLLPQVTPSEVTDEIYLTEVIRLIVEEGGSVIGEEFSDPEEFVGVNDRWQLAQAAKTLRMRILKRHALNGVTIVDPDSTFIEMGVSIDPDVLIEPMTVIEGTTSIGAGSRIGPNTWIKDSKIHTNVRIFMSHLDKAEMEDGSRCGPFANLRPEAHLGREVKVGNFVEIKKTKIGPKTSISHLTYIGDAFVGGGANIGAGTITCNYDGYSKHVTRIGNGAFIGSNSTLVAPVSVGDGAMTAAGSVINKDVEPDAMAIGRAQQVTKEGWAKTWRSTKK
jgi:bifunctional UDP-N-acetylglucosamine pyrophosphorylase / glucosamine-1-phosphate N-acetyltransferase